MGLDDVFGKMEFSPKIEEVAGGAGAFRTSPLLIVSI